MPFLLFAFHHPRLSVSNPLQCISISVVFLGSFFLFISLLLPSFYPLLVFFFTVICNPACVRVYRLCIYFLVWHRRNIVHFGVHCQYHPQMLQETIVDVPHSRSARFSSQSSLVMGLLHFVIARNFDAIPLVLFYSHRAILFIFF